MRSAVLTTVIALALSACGTPDGGQNSSRSAQSQRKWRVIDWPSTDGFEAVSCVYDYPRDLVDREIAFDGTLTEVHLGEYDEGAGGAPATLDVVVNEVFRGDIGPEVTMRTWDFMLPDVDITNVRILAAAGPTLDLMSCGFSRPYSESEAAEWRDTFGSGHEETG